MGAKLLVGRTAQNLPMTARWPNMPGIKRQLLLLLSLAIGGVACGSDVAGPEGEGPIYLLREQSGEPIPRTTLVFDTNGVRLRRTLRLEQVQFRTDFVTLLRFELHIDSAGHERVIVSGNVGQYEQMKGDTIRWCFAGCGAAPIILVAVLTDKELVVPRITAPNGSLVQSSARYERYSSGDSLLPWQ